MQAEEVQQSCTPLTNEQAFAIVFGSDDCTKNPLLRSMGGGRKYTRVRTRRSRRHAQRGGVKPLGPHAGEWSRRGEQLLIELDQTSTKTLRFYRLIIFIDILHLLKLDATPVSEAECKKLMGIIFHKLKDENILTAYFTNKFGSKLNVLCGTTGVSVIAYGISKTESIFSFFIRLLAYIPGKEIVCDVAHGFVDFTLMFYGIDDTAMGYVYTFMFLNGIYTTVRNFVTGEYPPPDFIEDNIGRLAPLYKYGVKPLFLGSFIQGYDVFKNSRHLQCAFSWC